MPPDTPRPTRESWVATITAAILHRGSMVHAVSVVLTLAAILAAAGLLALQPRASWLAIAAATAMAGAIEFWLATRVAIDADLFASIATRADDLDGFDRAMRDLGLLAAGRTARTLSERSNAAFRLLKLQGAACALQIAVLLAGAACG